MVDPNETMVYVKAMYPQDHGLHLQVQRLIEDRAELFIWLKDAIGVVQAAIVNARSRNDHRTIIEGLENREAKMRAVIAKAETR